MKIDDLKYALNAGARRKMERYLRKNPNEDPARAMRLLGIEPNGNHNGHKSKHPSRQAAGHQRTQPLATRS